MATAGVSPALAVSLKDVAIPPPTNLHAFLRGNPAGTPAEQAEAAAARQASIVLGKALFWDMQVGSDDVQACASCHFNAGADPRPTNQLGPGDAIFGNSAIPGVPGPNESPWLFGFGPNMSMAPTFFPFHLRNLPTTPVDPLNEFGNVIRDTNDVVSSQGVREQDMPFPFNDGVFNWLGANQRRVEPRNAPTMINAALHLDMFWDGRASFVFNGVNPFGFRDRDARVQRNNGTEAAPLVEPVTVRIPFASHASQSVGPPLSDFEMAGTFRSFPELGDKLVDPATEVLGLQVVHPDDSVLGPYAKAAYLSGTSGEIDNVPGTIDPTTGGDLTYLQLIQEAFRPEWWNGGTEQVRQNFSLFFGLAMLEYQATLISDETPFDLFIGTDNDVRGGGGPIPPDPNALTQEEVLGLDIFQGTNLSGLNPDPADPTNPLVGGVNGLCFNCHILPETTNHNFVLAGADPAAVIGGPTDLVNVVVPNGIIEAMPMGVFVPPAAIPDPITPEFLLGFGLYDVGFYNIGVRPTNEDLGRFGKAPATTGFPDGLPFSYVELARMKEAGTLPADVADFVPDIPAIFPQVEVPLADGTIVLVDIPTAGLPTVTQGAFKVPNLRNQEFQGPYFHNGGDATLRHVVEFYTRGGNFPQTNLAQLDPEIGPIPGMAADGITDPAIAERNIRALVAFLARGLTDPRVANEAAPFDHPQLIIPEGANVRTPGDDRAKEIKATGAAGAGQQIPHFLGLDPQTAGSVATLGRISGRVTSDVNGNGVQGIRVSAHRLVNAVWQEVSFTYTDGGGFYTLSGLEAGDYRVRFFDEAGTYAAESYLDAPYVIGSGNDVNVAGATTPNINASLAPVVGDAYEPDDDSATVAAHVGDAVQQRSLDPAGDADWIRIDGRAGSTYTFETSGDTPVDTVIEIRSQAGARLALNNDGGSGTFSLLSYTPAADETFYVRISGYTSAVAGPYTLTITGADVTPPVTTSDARALYNGAAAITLTATDDWSGVEETTYRIDGGEWTVGTTISTSVLGAHTVEFYSSDVSGNTEDPATVTFDVKMLDAVYRFYNVKNGTHFYTASASERDNVIQTLGQTYTYEGVAYYTNPDTNSDPLYRFYNKRNGSHFYRVSLDEMKATVQRLSDVYQYEGETYKVAASPGATTVTVYRFYHLGNGSHFFTTDESERDQVMRDLGHVYQYEGPAFYLGQ